MKLRNEAWNIVVAGHWNQMIFMPDWVAENIYGQGTPLEAAIGFMPGMPVSYRAQLFNFEVVSTRITVTPNEPGVDGSLLAAATAAIGVLQALPHTPIQAVGINIGIKEDKPAGPLLSLFSDNDDLELGQLRWSIHEKRINRQLKRDDETLNLAATLSATALLMDFNFHAPAASTQAAGLFLSDDRIMRSRDMAYEILQKAYGLSWDEE